MTTIQIFFAPRELNVYNAGLPKMVAQMYASGAYTEKSEIFEVNGSGKNAAEEVFDLTNNPGRQDEREEIYGRGRSLSVGDIVVVGQTSTWLCMPNGWLRLL